MVKQEFDDLKTKLIASGYNICTTTMNYSDYYYYKGFYKKDNKWEEDRNGMQIILYVYDYTIHSELWERMPPALRDAIHIEVHFDVSRTIDERIELVQNIEHFKNIEDIEWTGEQFYKWVCQLYPEPRKE